jgi:hypothetical protein
MALVLPVPGTRTGPQYATDINTAIETIDAHDHSSGKGVRVTPAGLDISSDLDIDENNLTNVRTIRMLDNTAPINADADLCAPYFYNGDFWIRSGTGAAIQITSGSSVLAGASSANTWELTTVNSNTTLNPALDYVRVNCTNTTPITVTLPAANAVGAGRFYVITDAAGTSQTNTITLASPGSDLINGSSSDRTLASNHGTWFVTSDGVSKWTLSDTIPTGGTVSLTTAGLTVGLHSLSSTALSLSSSPATTGLVRLPNATAITARNQANSGNLTLIESTTGNDVKLGSGCDDIVIASTGTSTTSGMVFTSAKSRTIVVNPMAYNYAKGWSTASPSTGNNLVVNIGPVAADNYLLYPLNANLIDGATLASVTVHYQLANHAGLPTVKMWMGLWRFGLDGDATGTNGGSLLTNSSSNDFTYGTYTTRISQTFTCVANNVIDRSLYSYRLQITDEVGTNSVTGNIITNIVLNFTTITNVNIPQ